MKKKYKNQEENIVLDEEIKKESKKTSKVQRIVVAVLLIMLAILFAVLGFCVVGGVFDNQNQCNIAYAAYDVTLPDNGVPNPNLVKNSCFTFDNMGYCSYSASDKWVRFYDYWQILNADVAFVDNSLSLNFNTSTDSTYKRFCSSSNYFYELEPNKTYTLSVCYFVNNVSGSVACRINNAYSSIIGSEYLDSGSPSVNLEKSTGLHISSCSFTLASSLPQGRIEIIAQNNLYSSCNINLYWFKLEEGDCFTGYVPHEDDLRIEYDNLSNWRFFYQRSKVVGYSIFSGEGVFENDGTCYYLNSDTNIKVFLLPRTVRVSEIINDDFTLKLKIKGLNTNDDVGVGVCYQLFDLTGYRDFYNMCAMASQTPISAPSSGSTNGCLIYSYDKSSNTLYEILPSTFPDKTTEARYLDIVNSYENFGRYSEQTDFDSTADGVISVIEAPVNFLKNVFNFEIFGINVSSVVFFVLSIVIVAFVVKKVV